MKIAQGGTAKEAQLQAEAEAYLALHSLWDVSIPPVRLAGPLLQHGHAYGLATQALPGRHLQQGRCQYWQCVACLYMVVCFQAGEKLALATQWNTLMTNRSLSVCSVKVAMFPVKAKRRGYAVCEAHCCSSPVRLVGLISANDSDVQQVTQGSSCLDICAGACCRFWTGALQWHLQWHCDCRLGACIVTCYMC